MTIWRSRSALRSSRQPAVRTRLRPARLTRSLVASHGQTAGSAKPSSTTGSTSSRLGMLGTVIKFIGGGDGGKGRGHVSPPPKIREKYFSRNYYVKFGHFSRKVMQNLGILLIFRANIIKIRVF